MSFSLKISPKDRATGRFKSRVNRKLLNAVLSAKKERGLTQSQIAELIGVDKSTISKILNGKGNLTLKTIGDISWAVGLVPDIDFKKKDSAVEIHLSNSGKAMTYRGTQNANSSANAFQYKDMEGKAEETSSRSREVTLQTTS